MKSDPDHLLSVSRATMGLRTTSVPGVRTECESGEAMALSGRIEDESAGVPPLRAGVVPDVRIEDESVGAPPYTADEGLLPDVVGVPVGAFTWS